MLRYNVPNTYPLDWLKTIKTKYTKAHSVLETLISRSLYHSIPECRIDRKSTTNQVPLDAITKLREKKLKKRCKRKM